MNSYQDIVKKQLRADKKKNTLMIIGIIISVALLTSYSVLEIFNKNISIEQEKRIRGDYDASIQNLPVDELEHIRKNYLLDNIGVAQLYNEGIFEYKDSKIMYEVYSLNDIALNKSYKNTIKILEGTLPSTSTEILTTPMVKSELKKEIGDEIVLEGKIYTISGFGSFTNSSSNVIVGITCIDNADEFENLNILFDIKENKDRLNNLYNVGADLGYPVITNINTTIDNNEAIEGAYIRVNDDLVRAKEGIYNTNEKFIGELGYILISTFTVLLVYAYISASISDKIKQISTLRCIGATPKQIRMLVFKESLTISTVAIIPGVIIGYALTYVVTECILEGMMGMNFYGLSISIYPLVILKTISISYLTVLIASIRPAFYASRIAPIEGVVTKGLNAKNHKLRRNKFVRKRFGLVGDISYRNMRSSKNFVINTLVLSISMIILIVFTSYAQITKIDIEFQENKIPADARVMIHEEDIENKMNEVSKYLEFNKTITNIKNIIEINHPVMIEESSINIEYPEDSYDYIQDENNTHLYLGMGEKFPIVYTYSDKAFEEIKKNLSTRDTTLEEFKDNGLIVVTSDGDTPINKEIGDSINIRFNEYSQYDVYDINEYMKQTIPISLNVVSTIDNDDILEPYYSHQYADNIKFIIHEDVYFEYVNSLESYEGVSSNRANVLFDFVSKGDREYNYNDLSKNIEVMGHWYEDNQERQEMYKNQLAGISILTYSAMAILISIIFINISNSRTVNMLTRMKEFAMLLSVGMNKKQLKIIIVLESLIQSIIASIIAIILSYTIVSVMGNLMVSGYNIHRFEMSIIPFVIGGALITIINSMTSIKPLDKINELSLVDMMKSEK